MKRYWVVFAGCQIIGFACITTELGYTLQPLRLIGMAVLLFPASIGFLAGAFEWVSSELVLFVSLVLCNAVAWRLGTVLFRAVRTTRGKVGKGGCPQCSGTGTIYEYVTPYRRVGKACPKCGGRPPALS
jgi:hypothetical protein